MEKKSEEKCWKKQRRKISERWKESAGNFCLLLLSLLRGLCLLRLLALLLLIHPRHAHPLLRCLLLFPLLRGHASNTHVALARAAEAANVLRVHAVGVLVQHTLRLLDAVAVQLRTLIVVCVVLALRH